jgi:hypothetical protein
MTLPSAIAAVEAAIKDLEEEFGWVSRDLRERLNSLKFKEGEPPIPVSGDVTGPQGTFAAQTVVSVPQVTLAKDAAPPTAEEIDRRLH